MLLNIIVIFSRNFFKYQTLSSFFRKIVLFCFTIIFGYISGRLLDISGNELLTTKSDEILKILFIGLLALPFLRIIIPFYQPLRNTIKGYYPVAIYNKFLISVILDLLSDFFLFLFLFLFVFSIVSQIFNFRLLVYSSLLVLSSHLCRRVVQKLIEFRYSLYFYLVTALIIVLLIFFSINKPPYESSNIVWILILFSILLLLDVILENSIQEQKSKGKNLTFLSLGNIYSQLIIYNKAVRISLSVGFSMKILMFLFDAFLLKKTGRHLLDGNILYWIFIASPIFYFSYVFNNFWGSYPYLWLRIRISAENGWIEYLKVFFKTISIPLLVDSVVTLIFLLVIWDNQIFIISYYLLSLIFLCCFSLYWSFKSPVLVNTPTIFKISHSPEGNFFCMVGTGLLYLLRIDVIFYLLIPLYIIISMMLVLIVKSKIKKDEMEVYVNIFS